MVIDLAIPRLIERIIGERTTPRDRAVVLHSSLIMLAISAPGAAFAAPNNVLSVRVAESAARDLREVLPHKIQT